MRGIVDGVGVGVPKGKWGRVWGFSRREGKEERGPHMVRKMYRMMIALFLKASL